MNKICLLQIVQRDRRQIKWKTKFMDKIMVKNFVNIPEDISVCMYVHTHTEQISV